MSEWDKQVPEPVPQAEPFEARFPDAARPTGGSGDKYPAAGPVPQAAPVPTTVAKIKE